MEQRSSRPRSQRLILRSDATRVLQPCSPSREELFSPTPSLSSILSDGLFILNALFVRGAKQSNCLESCNANNDTKHDISDATFLFN